MNAYEQGFVDKCAGVGIDPEELLKEAARLDATLDLLRNAGKLSQGLTAAEGRNSTGAAALDSLIKNIKMHLSEIEATRPGAFAPAAVARQQFPYTSLKISPEAWERIAITKGNPHSKQLIDEILALKKLRHGQSLRLNTINAEQALVNKATDAGRKLTRLSSGLRWEAPATQIY